MWMWQGKRMWRKEWNHSYSHKQSLLWQTQQTQIIIRFISFTTSINNINITLLHMHQVTINYFLSSLSLFNKIELNVIQLLLWKEKWSLCHRMLCLHHRQTPAVDHVSNWFFLSDGACTNTWSSSSVTQYVSYQFIVMTICIYWYILLNQTQAPLGNEDMGKNGKWADNESLPFSLQYFSLFLDSFL